MTRLRTSGTLVLAAFWFVTAVSAENVITCDDNNSVTRMSCDSGVISVETALYGRANADTCSEGQPKEKLANTGCAQEGTVDILKKRCDGLRWCEVQPRAASVSDPCPETFKYLELAYTCFPALNVVLCEHSESRLKCDEGQVIIVYGAHYGRRDRTTCSYRRPKAQLENVDCSYAVSKVGESCNGKNECLVRASNADFGDPCVGTFKYLELAYTCSPTSVNVVLCEHTEFRLKCDEGQVIIVNSANYGRRDGTTCSENRPKSQLENVDCSNAVSKVGESCNGKNECLVRASNADFGDPCVGTFKYLELAYTCSPTSVNVVLCEHTEFRLKCDEGQVIIVNSANYGRRDGTTCSENRPKSQLENVYCSSAVSKVGESCNGKNECLVRASNADFGDPCPGTFKYLELAYTCQYLISCPVSVSAENVITCDDNSVTRMSCDSGVISVETALYGRANADTCSEGQPKEKLANTGCAQEGTVDILKKRCDGLRWCEVQPRAASVSDPCPETFKYLELAYTCFPALNVVLCEHSESRLKCDEGQVIIVYGAHYGRRDRTTCSYKRPKAQLENVDCSNAVSKVGESCNGKNECLVRASNADFGDPCVGTFKYLELAYTCQYPV
ncbi:uncharacterized protein [Brachionichthys hirsutus]|uniref:uncharacterized protein n=1 Tax=Brachionichthys hirsutus TaxID=412623 RepID=UPI0036048722